MDIFENTVIWELDKMIDTWLWPKVLINSTSEAVTSWCLHWLPGNKTPESHCAPPKPKKLTKIKKQASKQKSKTMMCPDFCRAKQTRYNMFSGTGG